MDVATFTVSKTEKDHIVPSQTIGPCSCQKISLKASLDKHRIPNSKKRHATVLARLQNRGQPAGNR